MSSEENKEGQCKNTIGHSHSYTSLNIEQQLIRPNMIPIVIQKQF